MSQNGKQNGRRHRRPAPKKTHQVDVWREGGEMPEVRKFEPPHEVGALLRSLGDPPVGNGTAAGHYFNAVVERSAAVALALAVSADLLAPDDL